jgi:hypothetical protein
MINERKAKVKRKREKGKKQEYRIQEPGGASQKAI